MTGFLADLKHALRLYWRTPGASIIAVVALAVGMAFVGAFLSLYVDLVLRPHPGIEQSSRIVTIGQTDGTRFTGMPNGLIERLTEEVTSLEAVAGVQGLTLPIGSEGGPAFIEIVSREFFEGIRPQLAMGRGFERSDHELEAERVVVISDRYWRDELDADPNVLGTIINVDQRQSQPVLIVNGEQQAEDTNGAEDDTFELRIIGVMAPEMRGVMSDQAALWAPFESMFPIMYRGINDEFIEQLRTSLTLRTVGRLRGGASADAVAREISARYPESTDEFSLQTGFRFDVVEGVVQNINVHRDATRQLQLFLTGSILLALVAAANVSLFLLARAPGRRRELAIRMSVGAPIKRLARQLASEAGLLVLVSAVLGLIMSIWLSNFLRGLAFLRQAEWSNVTLLDWRVLSLVGLFLLLLTLLVSLAPILGLKRLGIASSSRQVAARATLSQRVAGTAQIAIAGALGAAAIAFAWYLGSMVLGYPGYQTENRYSVQFSVIFQNAAGNTIAFFNTSPADAARQRETIEALPGVSAVTFSSLAPARQTTIGTRTIPDPSDPAQEVSVGFGNIDSRFVEVLGLRLLYGRSPSANESGSVLVNRALARQFFGRDNVVGESLELTNSAGSTAEIIGVLEDLSFVHPAADVDPIVFQESPPSPFGMTAIVNSPLPVPELRQLLQGLIDSGELELGPPNIRPLDDLRENVIAPDKARSLLTIATASLVVLLAALGFYGTQRYLVTAGRREYAIRASLGAGPRALGRLVFWRGFLLSLPGLVAGALLAFIVVAWLRDDFISRDISPSAVTIAVLFGLTLLLVLASLGPARQARRTQPAPLLRED